MNWTNLKIRKMSRRETGILLFAIFAVPIFAGAVHLLRKIPVIHHWQQASEECSRVCGDRGVISCEETRVQCGGHWEVLWK